MASETERLLNDIRAYLRIAAAISSRPMAMKVFDTAEKAIVYTTMDGHTSQQKIADAAGVPQRTIANWAEDFVKAGLASPPNGNYASHRALFSLSELGIDVSILKKRGKLTQHKEQGAFPSLNVETEGSEAKSSV